MTHNEIVKTIRAALAADKRTSAELSKATGIYPVAIRQFKGATGNRNFPLPTLIKLADALGLEIKVAKRRGTPKP